MKPDVVTSAVLASLALLASLASIVAGEPSAQPLITGDAVALSGRVSAEEEAQAIATVAAHRDGPELEQARRVLDGLLADDLREPARIDRTRHQIRLVAAANAGSLSAAARLVDLCCLDGLEQVSCSRPAVAAWRDDARSIGLLHAGQVYAQVWLAHRRGAINMMRLDNERLRTEWCTMVQRWPLRHPMLLAQAVAVFDNVAPPRQVEATALLGQTLVALANDPVYAGDDLLAMEARGLALEKILEAMDPDDLNAARAILAGAASRCAERGLMAGVGVNLEALGRLSGDDQDDDKVQSLLSEAEAKFAEAGDIARQGRCRATLATLRWYDMQKAAGARDARATAGAYRDAADLCRRAGDWLGYGAITMELADVLNRKNSTPASPSSGAAASAAAYADAAAAFARADDASEQGQCLFEQANVTTETCRTPRDWVEVAAVLRQAETCFRRGDDMGADDTGRTHYDVSWWRLRTVCDLADALGALDDHEGAHAAYALLEEQLGGLTSWTAVNLRRRLHLGLRNYPP